MKVINLIVAFVITISLSSNAISSDWKFYGGSFDQAKDNTMLFYDSESVIKHNKIAKVWISIILSNDIIELRDAEKLEFIEKTKTKIANKYRVPFAKNSHKISDELNAFIITYELVANHPDIKRQGKLLYEIDCVENKSRVLAVAVYIDGKLVDSSSGSKTWKYIVPDSSPDTLAIIVCNSKVLSKN